MKGLNSRKIFDILGRQRVISALIILIILLSVTTLFLVVEAVKENKVNHITYTEGSTVGYNVHLKKNDFFDKKYLTEDKQYIASLIDYVKADFNYNLRSSEPNTDYAYTYKIVAETEVLEEANQNSIYKLSEDLVPEKTSVFNSNSILQINEPVKIDYNKYNDVINRFIEVYNLDEIKSTVTIKMFVKVAGVTQESQYGTTPVASLVIPLTKNTVAIDIESNAVNATDINVYKEIAKKEYLYIAVLTFTLTLVMIVELFIFKNNTKDEESVYKMKIKKILLNYDSYIQKTKNAFNYDGYQQLEMKSFEDLLQIRDTINQPIFMIEKEGETDFLIPAKDKVVYIYKLKLSDTKKNNQGQEKDNKEKLKV